ncbi:heparinase II/III family protein [candidate division KSB1 bacterium]|nr:heparinase II/III family protein [candidate division KSB1 bacterium]
MTTDQPTVVSLHPGTKSVEMELNLPNLTPGRYGLHLFFSCRDYPLERHCCYMRPIDPAAAPDGPRRFDEMQFSLQPSGRRVGPWPGWREVPPMPAVVVTTETETVRALYNFYGDETASGQVRAIALVNIGESTQPVHLKWNDARLCPFRLEIIPDARKRACAEALQPLSDRLSRYPRLLFTWDELVEMQNDQRDQRRAIQDKMRLLLQNWDLPDRISAQSKLLPGPERLRDFDRLLLPAFMALLDADADLRRRAMEQLLHTLDLCLSPDYEPMAIDTQSGECLFSLSLAVDWLWPFLSTEWQEMVRDRMFAVADRVWAHIGTEREDYAQAHFLGAGHGLLAFCFLFWETHPRAAEWAAWIHGAFLRALDMLPPDGFYPHGINLWIYEHAFFMRLLELFRGCAGRDYWRATLYWQNASRFRAATISDDGQWGVTFGDPQYRVGGDAWMHLLIAARLDLPAARQTAERLIDGDPAGVDFRNAPARRRIWEFLYFSPLETNGSNRLPAVEVFPDGGQIFWRSGSYLVTLRAGAPLGIHRHRAGEWSGYGHSDPGHGGFLVADDQGLLVCGPGPVYRRDTALHNTLTFDGRGQIGDSMVWASEFTPADRFARLVDHGRIESGFWADMDLMPAYLDFLRVRQLRRKVIWIPPGLLITCDRIRCDRQQEIQWNLHAYHPWQWGDAKDENKEAISGPPHRRLFVLCLTPRLSDRRYGISDFVPAYPHAGERDYFLQWSVAANQTIFINAVVFAGDCSSIKVDAPHARISACYNGRDLALSL